MPTKNTIKIELSRQVACKNQAIPTAAQLKKWVLTSLNEIAFAEPLAELTVRAVTLEESAELNREYRGKNGPTNVLSFPDQAIPGFESNYIGDLIICAELVAIEAEEQKISLEDHWAHLVVHGTLHLMGYDHMNDEEADIMEGLEIRILAKLGIADPY